VAPAASDSHAAVAKAVTVFVVAVVDEQRIAPIQQGLHASCFWHSAERREPFPERLALEQPLPSRRSRMRPSLDLAREAFT
jgi:hypothetical protein